MSGIILWDCFCWFFSFYLSDLKRCVLMVCIWPWSHKWCLRGRAGGYRRSSVNVNSAICSPGCQVHWHLSSVMSGHGSKSSSWLPRCRFTATVKNRIILLFICWQRAADRRLQLEVLKHTVNNNKKKLACTVHHHHKADGRVQAHIHSENNRTWMHLWQHTGRQTVWKYCKRLYMMRGKVQN